MKSNKDISGKNYHQQAHLKKKSKIGKKKTHPQIKENSPGGRKWSHVGERKIKKK